jgi:hypothetical protein
MHDNCVPYVQYRYRKAQFALQKGEEDLAREALKRRKSYAVSFLSKRVYARSSYLLFWTYNEHSH